MLPTLDVILTETPDPLTQKQADFLAQASNQGGGEHDKSNRPRERRSGRCRRRSRGVAPRPMRAQSPAAAAAAARRASSPARAPDRVRRRRRRRRRPTQPPLPRGQERSTATWRWRGSPPRSTLRSERYAKRPKRKFVSASTQEYAYAGYMRAWVDRVERVGNLNYPDEARRRTPGRHAGDQRRDPPRRQRRARRDHPVQRHPLLDDAALRIVRLAEPFRRCRRPKRTSTSCTSPAPGTSCRAAS